jgi:hypothetical protein
VFPYGPPLGKCQLDRDREVGLRPAMVDIDDGGYA